MSFSISFDEESIGTLSPTQIENFSFVSSIYKIYSGAKLTIKDFTKTLNNKLKTGQTVSVSFFNREGDIEYENKMAVLSYAKSGSGQFIEYVNVTLISAIFFEDTEKSITRTGNVGQIVRSILTEEFKIDSDKMSIEDTDDRVRRRYQLSEKSQDFLKRITKYGTSLNTSVYLYTAPDGIIYLKSIYNMITEQPLVVLTTMLADRMAEKEEGNDTLKARLMTSYSLNATGKSAVAVLNNVFCTDNFRFSSDLYDHWESYSTEKDNSQSAVESPRKTKFFNWNMTPDDAKAFALRDFFEETINTYSLDCTVEGWPLKDLLVGTAVYLLLPYEPSVKSSTGADINLGEGVYLITQSTFMYENREEILVLSLSQVNS